MVHSGLEQKNLVQRDLYKSAKNISWLYPGLGHMKLGKKKKGVSLAVSETISLALVALSWNNYNVSYNKYLDSKKSYDEAIINVGIAEQQYVSDNEAYQIAATQLGVSLFASAANSIYNIYDIKKFVYN